MDKTVKVKSIKIIGMNATGSKEVPINDVQYFQGKNGAGKTTVLNAIQLALLGYIPGEGKTNAAIFKHANNGTVMTVEVELEGLGSISRSWMKKGSSIQSSVSCTSGVDLDELTKNIVMPVMNFDEFMSLPANQMKDWFMKNMVVSSSEVNWQEALRTETDTNGFADEIAEKLTKLAGTSGLESVQKANFVLKDELSAHKATKDALSGSFASLVNYDDVNVEDEEQVVSDLTTVSAMRDSVVRYNASKLAHSRIMMELEKAKGDLDADTPEESPTVKAINETLAQLEEDAQKLNTQKFDLESSMTKLRSDISVLTSKIRERESGVDTCPYTHASCAELDKLNDQRAKEREELTAELEKLNAELDKQTEEYGKVMLDLRLTWNKQNSEGAKQKDILAKFTAFHQIKMQADAAGVAEVPPTPLTEEELDIRIAELRGLLDKIVANKHYQSMIDKVSSDLAKESLKVDMLRDWVNLTGPNGMQSSMSKDSFGKIEEDLTQNLQKLLGDETVSGKFAVEAKQNSFGVGLVRGDKFVEYDVLSSGEKCIFALALMVTVMSQSSSPVKLIMIDDMLDHLDDSNAERLFAELNKIKSIQVIAAGVKKCSGKFARNI